MKKNNIPQTWDLNADPRYKRQNMELAMRSQIERGLVELITNSNDSYCELEEQGKKISGKILIEIKRRKKGEATIVKVRDRAGGMSRIDMHEKVGTLGKRTSGFEKGKSRRGLHGRGARDVVAFGTVHFESVKDEEYNHLIIPPSLKCHFVNSHVLKANQKICEKLGIAKGNGTAVTIEVDSSRFKIPQHETILKDFSRYYCLRDIFSNPKREVIILDMSNRERKEKLIYKYPKGEVVFDKDIDIPGYHNAKARILIKKHNTPFQQDCIPYREGILIKSAAAIHDCTYFDLESEQLAWRFSGEVCCKYIDKLIREYEDREEANPDEPNHPENNPIRLLDPLRGDGLIKAHPFAQALYTKCKEILNSFIKELKNAEEGQKRDVTDENLQKKLDLLSKAISKVFEKKFSELEDEIFPGTIDNGFIDTLPIGLHIIPPGNQSILVNQPKTFSIIVKNYEVINDKLPVNITCSNSDKIKIRKTQIYLKKLLNDEKIGKSTFTVESSEVGAEALIEAKHSSHLGLLLVKIIEPSPPPELPNGLSFDKELYHLRINKEKELILWFKTTKKIENNIFVKIESYHPEIILKKGSKCRLNKTDTLGVFKAKIKVVGRQIKAKGAIAANIEGFNPAFTKVVVEEREPSSGIKLKFEPVEQDFGILRYKWDIDNNPYLVLIGAKHPSIRKYLGEPKSDKYPGIDSSLYHAVLAEVIAEALSFRILEKQFKRMGQEGKLDYTETETYYHKHFSEFLEITHNSLVTESIMN